MWKLPPLRLFDDPVIPIGDDWQAADLLKRTLAEFGVKVEVIGQQRGPAITRYELRPGAGVRISRVANLADDLALALRAKSIRIEAPIPGRSAIGIEVPNATKSVVTISEILSRAVGGRCALPMALGKDVTGQPIIADLTHMPHLLVAGATGSGKSVCLNNIIATLLSALTPDEVQLVLIDPKRVELTAYDSIPHLRGEVITDPHAAVPAMKAIIVEMEQRYELLQRAGVRKIEEFNARHRERLPYIVVVVDELADLMLVAKAEVETALCRLAQLARAVGIHLVVATQRPSVNVITGLLKANIPSRLAFAVSSQVDSMTILDEVGAEGLLGHGDMLFKPIDASRAVRAQGALVTSAEVSRLVDLWRAQGSSQSAFHTAETVPAEEEGDELITRAIAFVREQNEASTAKLKAHLGVGHARAARIMSELERRGVVEPPQGTKARRVLEVSV